MSRLQFNGKSLQFGGNTLNFTPDTRFKFTIETKKNDYVLKLPIVADNQATIITTTSSKTYTYTYYGPITTYLYNFVVDWGDGSPVSSSITDPDDALASHTYATIGTYQIKITGLCEAFLTKSLLVPDKSMRDSLRSVDSWGDVGLDQIGFSDCLDLISLPTDGSNLFGINSVEFVFSNCQSLKSIPSGLFDNCPNVTSFHDTFSSCFSLESIPSGLFDNNTLVTTYENTFQGCSSLTSIPSGLFDNITGVTTFQYAFSECTSLGGNAPELWNRVPEPIGINCFNGDTGLTNYGDIPAGWK